MSAKKRKKPQKAQPKPERLSCTTGTGDIQCPFFNAHNHRAIQCVDIYPGAKNITTNFMDDQEKEFQMDTYCRAEYRKCWLYDMAMKLNWDE